MSNTYLNVAFKDKDAAKALGARWDGAQRQWYVPPGRDIAAFAQWLPAGLEVAGTELTMAPAGAGGVALADAGALALGGHKGVSLSSLLAGVAQAVAQAYRAGVWTLVEVVELRANGGHVFLGVSERDAQGRVLAKASAVLWQSTANTVLPAFEQATGAQLAPGIKLLVRARPVFKAQHGFSLEIDAIDPEYTLGDLEARKREIRERLQAEGVYDANKKLAAPWDFNAVLVVAPEGAAGLGDFQAEADRLERAGLCRFHYVFSRFQGEGAAREVCNALQLAVAAWARDLPQAPPDAVVILRGGGAVNDLAWLNDYDLARFICDLPMPVFTGIGHERDNTVLDEVAHTRFDTPSKVAAGIEQLIALRAREARAHFEQVARLAVGRLGAVRPLVERADNEIKALARLHLVKGRQQSDALLGAVRLCAVQGLQGAQAQAQAALQQVKDGARAGLAQARREVPALWQQIALDIRHSLATASASHTALLREITGQGPEKTLRRGFAIVRDAKGRPLMRAAQVAPGAALEIEFQDGTIAARTPKKA